MASETLKVPTSTRPALIGLKGEKIQDIRNTSGATIWFNRQTGPITNGHIQGSREQIELAIAILKLSVLHARAKDYRPPRASFSPSRASQAYYDLHMFAMETHLAAACPGLKKTY